MEERKARKLVVIVHADVVGSTSLVQQDEGLAHERIRNAFRRFSRAIECYSGRTLELRGDALVAEFGRASDAVEAALAFQIENADFNETLDDPVRPVVRVGISLGEVVVADDTVTGEGVVLAQRLEQLAPGGGVCIQGAVYEAVPRRLPFEYESLGERELKGMREPVRAYLARLVSGGVLPGPEPRVEVDRKATARPRRRRVAAAALGLAALGLALAWYAWQRQQPGQQSGGIESAPQQVSDRPSIGVLPFDNMSGDATQDYFADGISEDLTTDLSKLSGLFVVARNSSFAYRDRAMDLRDVARELGVGYLLEGSVRRSGDSVRINAQLIDGSTGGHVWAERFDGEMSNIFQLQDEVNRKIVEALAISLTLTEREIIESVETSSPEAYDLLLRGLEQFHRSSPDSTREARVLFRQAIELDPDYARAYANIALTYASDVNFLRTSDKEQSIRLGLEYATRAVELDARIPQIHFARSALYLAEGKHDASIEAARRLIEVHPGYPDGHGMLAFALCFGGRHPEALEAIRTSHRMDPEVTYIELALEGRILFFLHRFDEAAEVVERSVLKNPGYDRSQLLLAAIYARLGRLDDAAWAIEETLAINPGVSLESERREGNYKRAEDLELYIESLAMVGLR